LYENGQKAFSFRGLPTCPWTLLGAPPQTPVRGSCSVLAIVHPPLANAGSAADNYGCSNYIAAQLQKRLSAVDVKCRVCITWYFR